MDEYWKGKLDQKMEFNDKEHGVIFDLVNELRGDVGKLKVEAAKSGSKWGAITAAVMSLAAYLLNKLC
jgi:hypothetical protein